MTPNRSKPSQLSSDLAGVSGSREAGMQEINAWRDVSAIDIADAYDIAIDALGLLHEHRRSLRDLDLSHLQTNLIGLRRSYTPVSYSEGTVQPEYSDSDVLAYLAAYFPAYVKMAEWGMRRSIDPSRCGRLINVALVGCGPCPEVAALLQLLDSLEENNRRLRFILIDRHHATWRGPREAMFRALRLRYPSTTFTSREYDVDIVDPRTTSSLSQLSELDLIYGQNVLNEIKHESDLVHTLNILLNSLKPDRNLMFVDQDNRKTQVTAETLPLHIVGKPPHDTESAHLDIEEPHGLRHRALWTLLDKRRSGLIPRKKLKLVGLRMTKLEV